MCVCVCPKNQTKNRTHLQREFIPNGNFDSTIRMNRIQSEEFSVVKWRGTFAWLSFIADCYSGTIYDNNMNLDKKAISFVILLVVVVYQSYKSFFFVFCLISSKFLMSVRTLIETKQYLELNWKRIPFTWNAHTFKFLFPETKRLSTFFYVFVWNFFLLLLSLCMWVMCCNEIKIIKKLVFLLCSLFFLGVCPK